MERTTPPSFENLDRLGPNPVEIFVGPVVPTEMMRSLLEGSGIPCAISGAGLEGAYPHVFPHRLFVPAQDADRANEIILAARTGDLDLDAEADDESPDEDDVDYDEDAENAEAEWAPQSSSPPWAPGPVQELDPWRPARIFLGVLVVAGFVAVVVYMLANGYDL